MKRSLLTLLCVTVLSIGLIVSTSIVCASAGTVPLSEGAIAGDINGDMRLDIRDVSTLLDMLSIGEHQHSYTGVTKPASCTEGGYTVDQCTVCGYAYLTDRTDAKGHQAVNDPAVPPTCTEKGLTAGSHCGSCGEVLTAQTTVAATGHTAVVDPAVPPTCAASGLTEGSHCGTCGEVLVAQTVLPAGEHTAVADPAVPATCTEKGLTAGSHCSVCKKVIVAQQKVDALGHNFVNDVCGRCGIIRVMSGNCGYASDVVTYLLYKESADAQYYGMEIAGNGRMNYYSTQQIYHEVMAPWRAYNAEISSVRVLEGVTVLGSRTFDGAVALTSVSLPEGLTEVGGAAFLGCTALTEIHLPSTVTKIDDSAFEGCTALKKINIPYGVTVIGNKAFFGCVSLTRMVLPDTVESINSDAFNGCINLEYVDFGQGIVTVWNSAFRSCRSLKEAILPATIDTVKTEAFYGCVNLEKAVVPSGSIWNYTFSECNTLTQLTLGEGVTEIGSYAFYNCYELVEIYNLSSLPLELGVNSYGHVSYYARVIHTDIEAASRVWKDDAGYMFYENGNECYLLCYTGKKTELTLPESCHGKNYQIHRHAFYKETTLTSVHIPNGVTAIGDYAFYGCTGLETLTGANSVTAIGQHALDGCTALKAFPVSDTVTDIGNYAFHLCTALERIDIQNATVGEQAFSGCTALKEATLGAGVTEIKAEAFRDCTALERATVENAVIRRSAFNTCRRLRQLTLGEGVKEIEYYAFENCHQLVEIYNLSSLILGCGSDKFGYVALNAKVIHPSLEYESYLFTDANGYIFYDDDRTEHYLLAYTGNDTVLNLPASCNGNDYKIQKYAFYNDTRITSVNIPTTVTEIGQDAFNGCSALKTVTGASGLIEIGNYAFYKCTALENAPLPQGLEKIGEYAFRECTSLREVDLPDSLVKVGAVAFADCYALERVTMRGKGYNNDVFQNCFGLLSVTVCEDVTAISYSAFYNCKKLVEIFNFSNLTFTLGSTDHGYIALYAKVIHTTNVPSHVITDENGYIFYQNGEECYLMGYNGDETVLTLPESCNGQSYGIYTYAFYKHGDITAVTLPHSLLSVGDYAFFECGALRSIYYDGTLAEWEAVQKDSWYWDREIGPHTVYCTDGSIERS